MDILELVHEDRSSAARPFACATKGCPKTFARRSDLQRHNRIHDNYRPFLCDWPGCPRDFIQRSALTVHYRVHTGERPHQCEAPGCNSAFSDSSSLARHRRIHTGTRPYKCSYKTCQKTFCRKTTLTKHLKRNHGAGGSSNPSRARSQASSVEYDDITPSPEPATPSSYDNDIEEEDDLDDNDGASYVDTLVYTTPKRVRQYRLPPTPQSNGYLSSEPMIRGDGSAHSAWSSPGQLEHYHEQPLVYLESGEGAYHTPSPRSSRYHAVPFPCGQLDCSFDFPHEHQPTTFVPGLVQPGDLHSSSAEHLAYISPPSSSPSSSSQHQYLTSTPQTHTIHPQTYLATPLSPCMSHSFSYHTSPLPQVEFQNVNPFAVPESIPANWRRRRASSTGALDHLTISTSSAYSTGGLGITFDEPPRPFSDYGDDYDCPAPLSPTYNRGRRTSSFSFPSLVHLSSIAPQPRSSFSSFVTQHIAEMEDAAQGHLLL